MKEAARRDRTAEWRNRFLVGSGWQRHGAMAVAGALSMLAFAPFFVWPILWLTLPAFYANLVNDRAGGGASLPSRAVLRSAALAGWWFGFGYHLAGLYWIGFAFLVEADIFGWLLPLAVMAMPAGLALFTAAAAALTIAIAPSRGVTRALAFALAFGITEWLRGHILTGFPWNVLGYALTYPTVMMQSAGVIGIYGLTVVAVLIFVLPFEVWDLSDGRADKRWQLAAVATALAPLTVMLLYGMHRLQVTPLDADIAAKATRVRIVQPSILQTEKWKPEHQRRIFDDHLSLSLTAPDGTIDQAAGIAMILWPEAAMPFLPLDQPIALRDIGRMLPPSTTLVSGALRAEQAEDDRPRLVFNSLMAFGSGESAPLLQSYDKTHLVPFGEYLPLTGVLEAIGLQNLSRLRGGFASGPEPRPAMSIAGIGELAPLICYEALFPGRVVQTATRPRALLNVTNDGWFGNSTGPRQHFHMSRVRAVEEGLPLLRAANNGISAVVNAHGVVEQSLAMDARGTIDARLPPRLPAPVYAQMRDFFFGAILFAIVVVIGLRTRTQFS